ncbi:MAG: symporter small accessory protein [Paludibacteraceae bacterium]
MFGIPDPGIWMAYLSAILCLIFSVWFGVKYWNENDREDE